MCLVLVPNENAFQRYDMGSSEYKMKFKEWPLEGGEDGVRGKP
jgi:hypothetical protein